jgi:hypothetical protein
MSAIIHFVGLVTLVTTTSITPQPTHILIPRFDDIIKKENNVIVIPHALVNKSATTWAFTQSDDQKTDMFEIKTRNIRISGTGDFTNGVREIPHLTCCCTRMEDGLKEEYNGLDPLIKKSAYVFLDHGTLAAPEDPDTHARHFQLSVPNAGTITITGQEKNKPEEAIVLTSGDAEITFANLPDDDKHDGHWAHYYRMSNKANLCTENPKNNRECAPTVAPDGCLNTQPAKKSVAAKKPAKTAKAAHAHTQASHCRFCSVVDINCSGSQWP